eukprot:12425102-Karenia_brevis.AAC.1
MLRTLLCLHVISPPAVQDKQWTPLVSSTALQNRQRPPPSMTSTLKCNDEATETSTLVMCLSSVLEGGELSHRPHIGAENAVMQALSNGVTFSFNCFALVAASSCVVRCWRGMSPS